MAYEIARRIVRAITPTPLRPMTYLPRLSYRRSGGRVYSGPFRGMAYVGEACQSCYIPKILGIYERELHGVVDEIVKHQPRLIVDIGAAEGYYAVGLTQLIPAAKAIAFEMESSGRELLHQMIELNRGSVAKRIEIRGKCEPEDLRQALEGVQEAVIVCDCEGYELSLLNPRQTPALRHSMILVETHDCFVPGITVELISRFKDTHVIEEITEDARRVEEFPFNSIYFRMCPMAYRRWAVNEGRAGKQSWLWMRPAAGNSSAVQ